MARLKEFDPEERLEKAKQLFWAKGYNATSMKDLVVAMKLNPGSIYDTFGGKEQLFLECLKRYSAEKLSAFQEGGQMTGSPLEVLENMLRKGAAAILKDGKACLVVKSCFELGRKNKEVHAIITAQANGIIAVFEELLEKAQQAGEIAADKDPKDLARFLYMGYNGLWQMDILYNDRKLVNTALEQLISSLSS
ncbi:TetR/AcrR family transcriptional regulator [Chitinophaga sp. RAB17]|uniref:TetR/AcrR family transcriptional regulator n=1 Tax=Chitinophaga sp. RAB17 TaxID=3233049 RepID=UPI003F8EE3D5